VLFILSAITVVGILFYARWKEGQAADDFPEILSLGKSFVNFWPSKHKCYSLAEILIIEKNRSRAINKTSTTWRDRSILAAGKFSSA